MLCFYIRASFRASCHLNAYCEVIRSDGFIFRRRQVKTHLAIRHPPPFFVPKPGVCRAIEMTGLPIRSWSCEPSYLAPVNGRVARTSWLSVHVEKNYLYLPSPDDSTRGKPNWTLPNLTSLTDVYARISLCEGGNIAGVRLIHDELGQSPISHCLAEFVTNPSGFAHLSYTKRSPKANLRSVLGETSLIGKSTPLIRRISRCCLVCASIANHVLTSCGNNGHAIEVGSREK